MAAREGYTEFLQNCLEPLEDKKEIVQSCLNSAGESLVDAAEEENHEETILYLKSVMGLEATPGVGYYCIIM